MDRRSFLKGAVLLPVGASLPLKVVGRPDLVELTPYQRQVFEALSQGKFVVSPRRAGKSQAAMIYARAEMKRGRQVHFISLAKHLTWPKLNGLIADDKDVSIIPQTGFLDTRSGGSLRVYSIRAPMTYSAITDLAIIDEPDYMEPTPFLRLLAAKGHLDICGVGTPREKNNLWRIRDRVVRITP